ncbi:MAG: TetR/AcrR family transcriptional regulator [Gammaproteobacteria bacterium]|nr:TetR/AcrR family transcriptional regulator [Gammaproteobacteria bacterium]
MSGRSTTDSYHHGDLKNALLQAAEQLLQERGASGFSLRDVARATGVSHTAPYRHFRDKAALLRALSGRGFERLRGALAEAAAGQRGPEQGLIEAGRVYVQIVVQNPGMTRLMFGGVIVAAEDDDNAWRPGSVLEVLVGIIRAGQRVGAFRDRDPQELALMVWSSMHGMAMLVGDASLDVDPDDMAQLDKAVRSMTENVLYGISRS